MMTFPYCKISCTMALLCTLLFALAGCGTPVLKYYVLDTVAAKQAAQDNPAVSSVSIRRVEIPRYLDRPRIVSRGANNQLHISEYHQWGGRLRENLAGILGDDLSERLGIVAVSTAPFPDSMGADISILVDVRQFERLADGYVHLNVRWVLQRSGNDTQNYYLRLQSDEVVKDKDYGAIAAAMSHLVGKLSDNMAQVILAIASEEHE